MKCLYCGNEFDPVTSRQKFCSVSCQLKWHKRNHKITESFICLNCGKEFHPKAKDRTKYCSRECAFEHKKAKPKVKIKKDKIIKCKLCGKLFVAERGSEYCSDECRKKINCIESKVNAKLKYISKLVKCKQCGKEFKTEYNHTRRCFCSDECMKKYGRKIYKHKRRAKIKESQYEIINPLDIYKRDKWICGICGKKINSKLTFPNLMCASLDHIVPLSLGGSHTEINVQSAHFICNSQKGNSINQLKLFG